MVVTMILIIWSTGGLAELSEVSNKSVRTINRIMSLLKAKGLIERIGSNKNGYWKVK